MLPSHYFNFIIGWESIFFKVSNRKDSISLENNRKVCKSVTVLTYKMEEIEN